MAKFFASAERLTKRENGKTAERDVTVRNIFLLFAKNNRGKLLFCT